ncbi:hypothetical protein THRCLA_06257 [Thraustotheca clavata]|uniref:Uncharacterized protein n=1 Tax=Thraustotheca clavata TaxID=74557 RepID=A0A1V9ZPW9_9STRA|nr:hypothetical protein THRCLA_06257 [Thraustotheca clavata]
MERKARPGQRLCEEHEIKYGVRVTSRDSIGEPTVAACRFCLYFGRQIKSDRARSFANQVKIYEAPFRMDNFVQHNRLHHLDHWITYMELDANQKKNYFPNTPPPSNIQVAFPPKRKTIDSKAMDLSGIEQEPKQKQIKIDAITADELLEIERKKHSLETEMLKKELELKNIQIITSTMLARQKMIESGVPQSEIDSILPLPIKTTNDAINI